MTLEVNCFLVLAPSWSLTLLLNMITRPPVPLVMLKVMYVHKVILNQEAQFVKFVK